MLRFIIISISTLGVLGAIFFLLVLRAQPARLVSATTHETIVPTGLSPVEPQSGVGPGKQPWVKNFEDGRLVSEFTASDFTPQKDGSFLAAEPKAIYYMNAGRYMLVTGDRGTMYCDSSGAAPANNSLFASPTGTPRNGTLHHVRIQLFPSLTATKPTQWMETDNIRFDNDTYRMYTESYTDHGTVIPADQVPVYIRGEQYEFDGKGLTMRWNAITHHLERLEVAHGRRLEIKDPTKLALPGMSAPDAVKPNTVSINQDSQPLDLFNSRGPLGRGSLGMTDGFSRSKSPQPQGVRLGRSAQTFLLIDKKPAVKVEPVVPYRAVFHDEVNIDQPDQKLAIADLMTVDFLQGSSKTKVAAVVEAPAEIPSTEPMAATLPSSQPAMASTTKTAASKPTNGPITITWTGPLLVTPIQEQSILPLLPGQSVVKMVGSPVKLTPQGSEVDAATAIYRNPDGAVQLHNSPDFPVVHLTQAKGLSLDTAGLDYDPATEVALLTGPNELNVPVAGKKMNVVWKQEGKLHVIRTPSQPNGIDQIDLTGDVAVTHPMFTLDSDHLLLNLDLLPKPGAKATDGDEQLKLLTATENVKCRLLHPGKPTQGINGDKLVIHTTQTADKHTVPREVVADGNVLAFVPDQSITAGHLDALLVPKATTQPTDTDAAVELDTLNADTAVHALLKSGATADSQNLKVTTLNGKQFVELYGPDGARLDNKKGSWLQGPDVLIDPDQGDVQVKGKGQLETIRNACTTRPSKPIDVTWDDSMRLQSAKNIADVHGNVTVTNVDAIGTKSIITGDDAHLDLMDSPKSTTRTATTEPDALGSAMGGKQLKVLTLSGHVNGDSELHAADGSLQRQSVLQSEKLVYNTVAETATLPRPGKMLMENHHPSKSGGSALGDIAVSWQKQLVYNQKTQIINIDGDTVTGFEKPAAKAPATPMRLWAQHLIITLSKAEGAKDNQGTLQLSHVEATDQVMFNANGADFSCDQVDYDPKTEILIASGHAKTLNADQTISGTFSKLYYNTATEEVIRVEGSQVKVQK